MRMELYFKDGIVCYHYQSNKVGTKIRDKLTNSGWTPLVGIYGWNITKAIHDKSRFKSSREVIALATPKGRARYFAKRIIERAVQ